MTDKLEETAQQIADQGREALIARLRPAFAEAAAAHSDVLDLTPEQLDAMVMRAVDRADGLQWRRALASVATEQLDITLGEALGHPAVARAQELAGAPSYEESLAQLGPLPGISAPPATPEPVPAAAAADDEGSAAAVADETAALDETPSDHVEHEEPMAAVDDAGTLAPPPPSDEEQAEAATEPEAAEQQEPEAEAATEPVAAHEHEPEAAHEHEPEAEHEHEHEAAKEHDPEPEPEPVPVPRLPLAELDTEPEDVEPLPEAEPVAHLIEEEPADHSISPDQTELPLSTAEYETVGTYENDGEYSDLDDALRVAVIHLGGIANLAPAERDIELQMSEDGLDIVRGGGEILGRLDWDQVKALEVPTPKGRRRMRRGAGTHLIVRTARGDASFEVPEVSPPELQQHLAPIVARHVRGS